MRKIVKLSLAVAMMSGLGAVSAQAADGMNILSDVKVKGQIRPRIETASSTGNTDDATAFTARTKLVITAGLFGVDGLTSTIGVTSVNNFGITTYGSAADSDPSKDYAKIADKQQAMLNAATIDYKMGATALHLGRSNINIDNQRFIGTVGWRQMDRSYDTAYAAYSNEKLKVLAAYLYGYAGVGSVTTTSTSSILLNASYSVMPELKVTAYSYMLASLHDTYGVALTGKVDVGAKITYRAEYAIQSDATMENSTFDAWDASNGTTPSGTAKADASYMNLDVGANISGILLGANYENLSGNDGISTTTTAFGTPLATGHKFNGWADVFLATPTAGLTDINVRAGYKAKGFGKLLAVYHMFSAPDSTASDTDYGTELDAVYVNKIPGTKNLTGLVKYANFTGSGIGKGSDVTKMWFMLDYKF